MCKFSRNYLRLINTNRLCDKVVNPGNRKVITYCLCTSSIWLFFLIAVATANRSMVTKGLRKITRNLSCILSGWTVAIGCLAVEESA